MAGRRASFTRMHDLSEAVATAAKLRGIMVTYHCDPSRSASHSILPLSRTSLPRLAWRT